MDTIQLTIDGCLDTEPVPGSRDTARFRLILSPTDDTAQETVLHFITGDPRIVHVLLTELRSGDLLRITGLLTLPARATGAVQLYVDELEVLQEVPLAITEAVACCGARPLRHFHHRDPHQQPGRRDMDSCRHLGRSRTQL